MGSCIQSEMLGAKTIHKITSVYVLVTKSYGAHHQKST